MKKENKKALFKFLGVVLLFITILVIGLNTTNQHGEYYKEVNLNFTGIIKEIKPLNKYGHGFGVIAIDIHDSNITNYDERKNLDKYLGVIKGKKADLVFSNVNLLKSGDSIVFKTQNYKIFRNGKLIKESVVDLPRTNFIFKPFTKLIS
ncbi:hypothetical protein [uncultured Psychroserpens sp.]|uniref:hypothetical protein n=1 Tax=uncultured Psychroserpens sp. TaxID=255436 RepID=UPI00261CE176|nr:hypothetical protein [uncultured Psychroserpens sp.]